MDDEGKEEKKEEPDENQPGSSLVATGQMGSASLLSAFAQFNTTR